ncbi:hypothetical protein GLOIN_2v1790787 [Rhizophagus clarus]|uniref:Uncharacterized protein n=1 Tax=Rhizophagus clarus TaxID=94130 RepID=A0A8H3QI36_9GLOM|nr:hypothetical protein GLOIN_2v1790787 [Rhizophagus clarus]
MSNIYQAIANLDSNEERTALRIFFIQNPKQRTEAELILPTCSSNEEVVAFLKELLKYVKPAQKTHSRYCRATRLSSKRAKTDHDKIDDESQ